MIAITALEPSEVVTPSQSGTYHIAVDGVLDSVGTYTVLVSSEARLSPTLRVNPRSFLTSSTRLCKPAGSANSGLLWSETSRSVFS